MSQVKRIVKSWYFMESSVVWLREVTMLDGVSMRIVMSIRVICDMVDCVLMVWLRGNIMGIIISVI